MYFEMKQRERKMLINKENIDVELVGIVNHLF